ncbi:MAG: hypothetical protein FWF79_04010, partial [Defluviitaleaceae bacterium]|nr:hypothetical protein [Defluviitaleaceae bacterium]
MKKSKCVRIIACILSMMLLGGIFPQHVFSQQTIQNSSLQDNSFIQNHLIELARMYEDDNVGLQRALVNFALGGYTQNARQLEMLSAVPNVNINDIQAVSEQVDGLLMTITGSSRQLAGNSFSDFVDNLGHIGNFAEAIDVNSPEVTAIVQVLNLYMANMENDAALTAAVDRTYVFLSGTRGLVKKAGAGAIAVGGPVGLVAVAIVGFPIVVGQNLLGDVETLLNNIQSQRLSQLWDLVGENSEHVDDMAEDLAHAWQLRTMYDAMIQLRYALNNLNYLTAPVQEYLNTLVGVFPRRSVEDGTDGDETIDSLIRQLDDAIKLIDNALNESLDDDGDDGDNCGSGGEPPVPPGVDEGELDDAAKDSPFICPIVLDLTGNGLETVGLDAGVFFDMNANGFASSTGWVTPTNGLLVLPNAYGQVTSGRELFGDAMFLRDGITLAEYGFQALAEFDENGDGFIDENDPIFHELRVWVDKNMNGIVDPGELYTLPELGIAGISVIYMVPFSTGNVLTRTSFFVTTCGEFREVGEFLFIQNPFHSFEREITPVSPEIAALPNIPAQGVMWSLHTAMVRDSVLQAMVENYVNEPSFDVRRTLVRPIIFRWANIENIAIHTRGWNVDARQLAVLETLHAQDFVGFEGTGNPNGMAGPRLTDMFTRYENYVLSMLETRSWLREIIPVPLDMDDLFRRVDLLLDEDLELGINALRSLDVYFQAVDPAAHYAFLQYYMENFPFAFANVIWGTDGDDVINVTNHANHTIMPLGGNDEIIISGRGANFINATSGNNIIRITGGGSNTILGSVDGNDTITLTGNGRNTIIPGFGNNIVFGGTGIDTYVIGRDVGHTTITAHGDPAGNVTRDRLQIRDGIRQDEVFFARYGNNLEIFIKGTDSEESDSMLWNESFVHLVPLDLISEENFIDLPILGHIANRTTFVNFFTTNLRRRVMSITFDDRSVIALNDIMSLELIIGGTDNDDVIAVSANVNHAVFGLAGNDTITITGNGNNTIDPGVGNNIIFGGTGFDTYVIGREYGYNRITANSNAINTTRDRLVFKDDISTDEIFLLRTGSNLEIYIMTAELISERSINSASLLQDVTNKIVFVDFFTQNRRRISDISFNDGTVLIVDDELIRSFTMHVNNLDEFCNIRKYLHGNFKLAADLDLSGIDWIPIGTTATPFAGTLNGDGRTISAIIINQPLLDRVGLFGVSNGSVSNLFIENVTIIGRDIVGSVAGINNGTIYGVDVNGVTITGLNNVGGLVGNNSGRIAEVSVNGADITAASSVGGLVGHNTSRIENATVSNSERVSGTRNVGGFVGNNSWTNAVIENASATGIAELRSTGPNIGGFAGSNSGTIRIAYATSDIFGTSIIGGFVGASTGGLIEQSFATGGVAGTGAAFGGFAGTHYSNAIIRNTFATGSVQSVGTSAGFVGSMSNTARVENSYSLSNNPNGFAWTVATTASVQNSFFNANRAGIPNSTSLQARSSVQMTQAETFEGWDFAEVWQMENGEHPMLRGFELNVNAQSATLISTVDELAAIRNNLGGRFRLAADIDLSGIDWQPIGTAARPFTGTLDGNGYTIRNITVNEPTMDNAGFFGVNGGLITNLTLENVNITGNNTIGGLAGRNTGRIVNVTLNNVTLISALHRDTAGGLVGYNSGGIENVAVNVVTITSRNNVGGFVGNNSGRISGADISGANIVAAFSVGGLVGHNTSRIENATVSNSERVSGTSNVGGFVGNNLWTNAVIENASATGIAELRSTGPNSGGFAGSNSGTIRMSYTTNDIFGAGIIGGFVGDSTSGIIEQSFATGGVAGSGATFGGFAGRLSINAVVRNTFATGSVQSAGTSAGFVGSMANTARVENSYSLSNNPHGFARTVAATAVIQDSFFDANRAGVPNSNSPQARTSAQMTQATTFEGWDFAEIWQMEDGEHPMLGGFELKANGPSSTVITTAEELAAIRNNLGGRFRLAADIDLAGIDWPPIGTAARPFTGTFDGNGYSIRNITVNQPTIDSVGLFGVNGGLITNLTIENVNISGDTNIGGLAGRSTGRINNVTINEVTLTTVLHRDTAGGLVGYNNGDIENVAINGVTITSRNNVGGLVGNNSGRIAEVSVTGADITASSSVGGLVGNNSGRITGADVSGANIVAAFSVGGLVGHNTRRIENATVSNSERVSGTGTIGGFVGNNSGANAVIENASATGIAELRSTSSNSGGFVGSNSGTIRMAYTTNDIFGTSTIGGFVGASTVGLIEQSFATGGVAGTGATFGGFAGTLNSNAIVRNTFATGSVQSAGTSAGFVGSMANTARVENFEFPHFFHAQLKRVSCGSYTGFRKKEESPTRD